MDVVPNTFAKWPQGAKRAKEINIMEKKNENAIRTQVDATHDRPL
jgi:hypothetical protein